MNVRKLNFLTAGLPIRTKLSRGDVLKGVSDIKSMGLDGMELEFVRGVWLKDDKTLSLKNLTKENNMMLTAHGPYFINLNSEGDKRFSSMKRVFDSARVLSLSNGYSLTFHAGYYLNKSKKETYNAIKTAFSEVSESLRNLGINIWLRPELTGKKTQFGDLDEIISLSQDVDGVLPCIDFAHYFARYVGRYNSKEDFSYVLERMESELGEYAIKNVHVHMSGIAYTDKGEKNHEPLNNSEFNWRAVIESLKDFDAKGALVSESPLIEEDALYMKKFYETL